MKKKRRKFEPKVKLFRCLFSWGSRGSVTSDRAPSQVAPEVKLSGFARFLLFLFGRLGDGNFAFEFISENDERFSQLTRGIERIEEGD